MLFIILEALSMELKASFAYINLHIFAYYFVMT
jgi:hypothetical protein